jgi:voltage-gated potassium channel Kch
MVGLLPIARQLIHDKDFRNLTIFVLVIIFIGTVFYHEVEGWGWLDSVYFCVMTLTTVGYGDLILKTSLGKLFTIFYVLVGIGILFGYIKVVAETAFQSRADFLDLISKKTMDLSPKFDKLRKDKSKNKKSE